MKTSISSADVLARLEQQAQRDLDMMSYPRRSWVESRQTEKGEDILDVLIVGGGQGGLGVASGLIREGVTQVLVVDKNPENQEGPWRTFARMHTLRTPKYVLGPDHGIPSLSFRSWYEAQHGEGSWDTLGLIPKDIWADYLYWFRNLLKIPVENNTTVELITWNAKEQCFALSLNHKGEHREVFARKVVLATGIEGSGDWQVPQLIRDSLPTSMYAHTREDINFEALKGCRVALLGAGASAFDNAATALDHGARSVDMFFRRKRLVTVNVYRWAESVGFLKHHADLDDAQRWKFIHTFVSMGQLPPPDTYARARQYPGFSLHPASPWEKIELRDNVIHISTPQGGFEADYVIAGTGFATDLSLRPELAPHAEEMCRWKDVYTPPQELQSQELGRHPYLGPNFEFLPKPNSSATYVKNIYNYTFGGLVSLGLGGASISGMKYGLGRIVSGITRELYREQVEHSYQSLVDYDVEDFEV